MRHLRNESLVLQPVSFFQKINNFRGTRLAKASQINNLCANQRASNGKDFLVGALLCLLNAFISLPVLCIESKAQQREIKNQSSSVDVVLLIDTSGSMLVTDPLNLRVQGAELFSKFLSQGDRLGIVSFSSKASIEYPLQEYSLDKGPSLHHVISRLAADGTHTSILDAVEKARDMFRGSPSSSKSKIIVLLSDGKMEPPPESGGAEDATNRLLHEVIPSLVAEGVKVFSLAFSNKADQKLLETIAVTGEGLSWFTENADAIHKSFADLLLAVKKPQVLPLTKKGFAIDTSIDEATFFINRGDGDEVKVTTPLGKTFTSDTIKNEGRWFKGEHFDVVTIVQPDVGTWFLSGGGNNEGFATVLTALKLVVEWPSSLREGDTGLVQARLYEGEKPISLKDINEVVNFAVQATPTDRVSEPLFTHLLHDDGQEGDVETGDGVFSAKISPFLQGEYRLRVLAKSPTFEREQNIPFRVRPPWFTMRIIEDVTTTHDDHNTHHKEHDNHGEAPTGGHEHHDASPKGDNHLPHEEAVHHEEEEHEKVKYLLEIQLHTDVDIFKNKEIKGIAVTKKGKRFSLPLTQKNPHLYHSSLSALPSDAMYQINGTLLLTPRKGVPIKVQGSPLTYEPPHEETPEETLVAEEAHAPNKAPIKKDDEPSASLLLSILVTSLGNVAALALLWFFAFRKNKESTVEAVPYETPAALVELKRALEMIATGVSTGESPSSSPEEQTA
jgi:uncharacterized protein (TIGR03503 family)